MCSGSDAMRSSWMTINFLLNIIKYALDGHVGNGLSDILCTLLFVTIHHEGKPSNKRKKPQIKSTRWQLFTLKWAETQLRTQKKARAYTWKWWAALVNLQLFNIKCAQFEWPQNPFPPKLFFKYSAIMYLNFYPNLIVAPTFNVQTDTRERVYANK